MCFGRCGETHDQLTVVDFIQRDIVMFLRVRMRVGPLDQGEANGHLGAEADHSCINLSSHKRADGSMDIAGVRRQEGAE